MQGPDSNSGNVSIVHTKPWYKRTGWIIVLLVFFFPLGILLMWLFAPWSNRTKGIITGVVGVVFLITMINDAATPEPKLNMNAPSQATTVTKANFQVKGKVTPSEADVSVNGDNVAPNGDGSFDAVVDLDEGGNEIEVVAVNGSKQVEYSRVVTRKLTAEEAAIKKEAEKKAAEERDKREAEEASQAKREAEAAAEEEAAPAPDEGGDDGTATIRVTGAAGEAFTGSYGNLDTTRSVDGTVPAEYEVEVDTGLMSADSVTAVMQKAGAGTGELGVEIVVDGEVVKNTSTTAEYGLATVTWSPAE